ncbi:MAG: tetratricopeptide repeat protein, partial [Candidatus Nanoarchaeia archaeon]
IPRKDKWNTLDELLQKKEGEFSLTEASLVLAKESAELNNDFDISEYLDKIHHMADKLKVRIAGKQPEEIISEINSYLFKEQGFSYNDNFFLNKVLDDKKGSCEGLSTLYLALAEQLDLPIYGITLPEHVAVRWDDSKFKRNIETTDEGIEVFDSDYRKKYNISQKSIKEGVYLRNLSKKEVVGWLLSNRGVAYADKGELDKAIQDFNKALELDPNFVEAYNNRGIAYAYKGEFDKAMQDWNKALELDPKYANAYYNRGIAYANKGEFNKAMQDLNKARELIQTIFKGSSL